MYTTATPPPPFPSRGVPQGTYYVPTRYYLIPPHPMISSKGSWCESEGFVRSDIRSFPRVYTNSPQKGLFSNPPPKKKPPTAPHIIPIQLQANPVRFYNQSITSFYQIMGLINGMSVLLCIPSVFPPKVCLGFGETI